MSLPRIFGFKPLVAGHTGPSAGVWAAARLEAPSDLAGGQVYVEGLAGDVMRDLGATPAMLAPEELRAALADGRLQAAEWLGPLAAAAPDLQPLAQRLYQPGFNRNGLLLSLGVDKRLWDGMSAADRAIFEACAVEAYHLSLTDARAHALIASQVEAPTKWPVRLPWPSRITEALDQAAAEAVERIAQSTPHRAASTTATRPSAACWASRRRPDQPFTHTTWRSVCTISTRSACAAITASMSL